MISSLRFQKAVFLFAIFAGANFSYAAETMEFPEEELATESVLPVFDKKMVVRNRAITTEKRFEIGGGVGLNLIEALYSNITYNLTSTYHFTETHGLNIDFIMANTDLSNMGEDLKAGKGIATNFDASLAPSPEYLIFGNYQFTTYYGKVSISKQKALNLSLYGLLGAGLVNWSDSTQPALNVGFGQKFYINNHFAVRLDLNLAAYRGPDPTSPKDNAPLYNTGKKSSDEFETIFYFRSFLRGALVYLF
jgi:outer membrane beta-barrel protein